MGDGGADPDLINHEQPEMLSEQLSKGCLGDVAPGDVQSESVGLKIAAVGEGHLGIELSPPLLRAAHHLFSVVPDRKALSVTLSRVIGVTPLHPAGKSGPTPQPARFNHFMGVPDRWPRAYPNLGRVSKS
jgi:hypothetical protein